MASVMKREQFIQAYLALFGVVGTRHTEVTDDSVSGTAIYDALDPEETQDFILRMR